MLDEPEPLHPPPGAGHCCLRIGSSAFGLLAG
ncbi:hypothetical protein PF005_g11674 [Phytophthora fragariae]|uniref:Uncharacterized protein n=1 Tax=Phytophthora fragariae TaxID=53985 RepID=A0A6A3S5Q4_9STRA|nr:hypothetical protein PF003_g23743 [Phytophthora fragariae]KAE8937137.1 hypothetical protein PF009_g12957 [Phytophthora fragariae]KAE9023654.1 hypothetical protein PF011_g3879 [Phytophthora fragariae]KAE9110191.1 hypothetical protein PF010_g11258 [Phytophthora fragariae]KAE9110505.1 hypothetical protein PF007_g11840 [Phytophthora fragariae]